MLSNLKIDSYRSLDSLQIDRLLPVNVIVGRNNSGKSTLLEAIALLASAGSPRVLTGILGDRGEFAESIRGSASGFRRVRTSFQLRHIFHGHELSEGARVQLSSDRLKVLLLTASEQTSSPKNTETSNPAEMPEEATYGQGDLGLFPRYLVITSVMRSNGGGRDLKGDSNRITLQDGTIEGRDDSLSSAWRLGSVGGFGFPLSYLTNRELDHQSLSALWDAITLTPKEDQVVRALQMLEPRLQRLSFTSSSRSNPGILLKLAGTAGPLPLGSMGEGMRRVLALTAAAVSAENGVLVVDEIDTGLHYSTLVNLWRLLLEVARDLKVQIFASTHSLDCLVAYNEALQASEVQGQLVRLVNGDTPSQKRAVFYAQNDLSVALRQEIEVR